MKRVFSVCLLFLTGCVVQSFGPFCTGQSAVYVREVIGDWALQKDSGDDVSANAIRAWVFTGNSATNCTLKAFDKQNAGASFAVRFFRLGKHTFVDIMPHELGDETKVNSYWTWTVRRTHTVCKVELHNDTLTLKPMDYDWLKMDRQKRKRTLPYVETTEDDLLFTANPRQWETFLWKHAANEEAFPDKHAFVLKRSKPGKG